jgi:hypothetical protein
MKLNIKLANVKVADNEIGEVSMQLEYSIEELQLMLTEYPNIIKQVLNMVSEINDK